MLIIFMLNFNILGRRFITITYLLKKPTRLYFQFISLTPLGHYLNIKYKLFKI